MMAIKPDKIDYWIIAIFWLLAAPFIIYSYSLSASFPINIFAFLISLCQVTSVALVIVFWLIPTFFKWPTLHYFITILLLILAVSALFEGFWTRAIFPDQNPWSWATFLDDYMDSGQQFGALGVALLAKQYLLFQRKYKQADQQRIAAELKLLRAQVNPHFLFNNLNVLGALIEQNPKQATNYLIKLANIYRFLIGHKDQDFISLEQEMKFTQDYIYLLEERFGLAYRFCITHLCDKLVEKYIVPGTLQSLIENVIKHNQGSKEHPLQIDIRIYDSKIEIHNELRLKEHCMVDSLGTGLQNIKDRYRLLVQKSVFIKKNNEMFIVSIPLIKSIEN